MRHGPADPLEWAKHPRSQQAAEAMQQLSQRDKRFRHLFSKLVESGVCTPEGRLLMRWEGTGWKRVQVPA